MPLLEQKLMQQFGIRHSDARIIAIMGRESLGLTTATCQEQSPAELEAECVRICQQREALCRRARIPEEPENESDNDSDEPSSSEALIHVPSGSLHSEVTCSFNNESEHLVSSSLHSLPCLSSIGHLGDTSLHTMTETLDSSSAHTTYTDEEDEEPSESQHTYQDSITSMPSLATLQTLSPKSFKSPSSIRSHSSSLSSKTFSASLRSSILSSGSSLTIHGGAGFGLFISSLLDEDEEYHLWPDNARQTADQPVAIVPVRGLSETAIADEDEHDDLLVGDSWAELPLNEDGGVQLGLLGATTSPSARQRNSRNETTSDSLKQSTPKLLMMHERRSSPSQIAFPAGAPASQQPAFNSPSKAARPSYGGLSLDSSAKLHSPTSCVISGALLSPDGDDRVSPKLPQRRGSIQQDQMTLLMVDTPRRPLRRESTSNHRCTLGSARCCGLRLADSARRASNAAICDDDALAVHLQELDSPSSTSNTSSGSLTPRRPERRVSVELTDEGKASILSQFCAPDLDSASPTIVKQGRMRKTASSLSPKRPERRRSNEINTFAQVRSSPVLERGSVSPRTSRATRY